jgi:hypothetical protein
MLEATEEATEMIRTALVLVILVGLLVAGATIASSDAPPPTPAQLKAQVKRLQNRNADLSDQLDTAQAVNDAQADVITRLRARDPLDAVTARGPNGLWDAMIAIWQEFPTLGLGEFCGYDKSTTPGVGDGLTVTSYSFYRWSGC